MFSKDSQNYVNYKLKTGLLSILKVFLNNW
jgi:hypothetical protein